MPSSFRYTHCEHLSPAMFFASDTTHFKLSPPVGKGPGALLGLTDAVQTDSAKRREAGRGWVAIAACLALMAFGLIAERAAAQQPEAAKPAEGEETTEAAVAKVAVASPCAVKR